MILIQILLPLRDNAQKQLPLELYSQVKAELTERFGGLTAYMQSPAEGLWKEAERETVHDEIIVFEVMAPRLETAWWRDYRRRLEERFRQETLVIRAQRITLL